MEWTVNSQNFYMSISDWPLSRQIVFKLQEILIKLYDLQSCFSILVGFALRNLHLIWNLCIAY